jgi:hypothetical protein
LATRKKRAYWSRRIIAGAPVPKPNYSYEKRQRELEKKRKKEDKAAQKKAAQPGTPATPQPTQS